VEAAINRPMPAINPSLVKSLLVALETSTTMTMMAPTSRSPARLHSRWVLLFPRCLQSQSSPSLGVASVTAIMTLAAVAEETSAGVAVAFTAEETGNLAHGEGAGTVAKIIDFLRLVNLSHIHPLLSLKTLIWPRHLLAHLRSLRRRRLPGRLLSLRLRLRPQRPTSTLPSRRGPKPKPRARLRTRASRISTDSLPCQCLRPRRPGLE
jgi:hypothetical protein